MTVTLNGDAGGGRGRGGGGQVAWPPWRRPTATVAEPVIEAVVSVAVTVWLPAVFRVTPGEGVRAGVGGGEGVVGGQHRLASLLVKWTVPV